MRGGAVPRTALVFGALGGLLLVLAAGSLCLGSVRIPVGSVLRTLFLRDGNVRDANILFKIRLPRMLMAAMLGGALALSGFLLQTYFQNPIAGPFVLGISSGAKLMVALAFVVFLRMGSAVSSWVLVAVAFWGAVCSTGFILLIARYLRHIASLLVAGIMVGYIASALTDLVVTFADDADIVNLHGWSQGSFSGMSLENCMVGGCIVGAAALLAFLLAKPIGAYQLGEAYAQSAGVNTAVFRPVLILLSSLLSATVAAFAGPISFVGIAVPFLVKRCFGTVRPLVIIPGVFMGGAVFCLFCDICARMVLAPSELNISVVTSLLGAPIVVFLLLERHGGAA